MSNLFTELKRRNVFRVAAAYLVGSWILLQIADALFPALNLPDWTTRFVVGLAVLGFPIALILAWAFEVTPEGVKRDSGAASMAVENSSAKRLDIATLVGVVIVIVIVGLQQFGGLTDNRQAVAPLEQPAAETAPPSIAVLAFENMSPDPSNAFFAEGISEEILNVLARIDGLHVASRTSAFSFANSNIPIPEIASQLKVNHILEGSVRKQDMRVRITAQLIDAENDKHLWSATYDRELTDIFAVQEEIAQAISDALMGALGVGQVVVDAPTDDLVAYELFLSGRKHFYLRGEALKRSIIDLRAAVARDPEFAAAWSFLAAAENIIVGYFPYDEAETEGQYRRSSEAAAKALQLDPNQALAVAIQAFVVGLDDPLRELELMTRAVSMAPNDAGLKMWAADKLFLAGGYLSESMPLYQRAIELDPLSGINNGTLGVAYLMAGRREEGRKHIRRAIELGWRGTEEMLVLDYLHTGERDKAVDLALDRWQFLEDRNPGNYEILMSIWQRIRSDQISADEISAMTPDLFPDAEASRLLTEYLAVGDVNGFFDSLLDVPHNNDVYITRIVFSPGGRAIVQHPRFLEFAEIYKLGSVWEVKGLPFDCVMVKDEQGEHLSCPNWPE